MILTNQSFPKCKADQGIHIKAINFSCMFLGEMLLGCCWIRAQALAPGSSHPGQLSGG